MPGVGICGFSRFNLIALTVFLTLVYFEGRLAPRSLYASLLAKKKPSSDVKKASTNIPASTSATRRDA